MGNKAGVEIARSLRRRQTEAEKTLWRILRNRQLERLKFRRQHRISSYIADFACVEKRLVIELDGGQHREMIENDKERTEYFGSIGYRVLRFWNSEVLQDAEGVTKRIIKAVGR